MSKVQEARFKHDDYVLFAMQHPKVYRPFFRRYLPSRIGNLVDLEQLAFVPQVLAGKKLKRQIMDHAYTAPFKEDPEKHLRLHIIFEHKSDQTNLNPLQMLSYKVALMQRLYDGKKGSKIPPVYPIVYYHGKHPYTGPLSVRDMLDVPDSAMDVFVDEMGVVDAHHFEDEELLEYESHLAIMFLATKHIFDRGLKKAVKLLRPLLRKLENSGWDLDYFDATVSYILKEGEAEESEEILNLLQEAFSGKKGELVMTVAEYLQEKGRVEGRQEGLVEGRQEGLVEGRQEGLVEGRVEGIDQTLEAMDLIRKGLSPEVVAREVRLPLDRVQQIASKMNRA